MASIRHCVAGTLRLRLRAHYGDVSSRNMTPAKAAAKKTEAEG